MKSGRPVAGTWLIHPECRMHSRLNSHRKTARNAVFRPQPDGPILLRFHTGALCEEEAPRHRSPWRAPQRIRPNRADAWRAAPWFSDSLPGPLSGHSGMNPRQLRPGNTQPRTSPQAGSVPDPGFPSPNGNSRKSLAKIPA